MRVLVTGGLGYAGSVVAARLLRHGHSVGIIDDASKGTDALASLDCAGNFTEWFQMDIADHLVIPGDGYDAVVHMAALVGDRDCESSPNRARAVNVVGTRRVLDIGLPTILFSTSAVYGSLPKNQMADEDSPVNPQTLYAETKAQAEQYAHEAGATILRLNHMFGASPSGRWPELVNELTVDAIRKREVRLYHPTAWRAVCHVDDAAHAVVKVLNLMELSGVLRSGIWNVVGENVQKRDITQLIQHRDSDVTVMHVEPPNGDPRHNLICGHWFRHAFDFRPRRTVADGIAEAYQAVA